MLTFTLPAAQVLAVLAAAGLLAGGGWLAARGWRR